MPKFRTKFKVGDRVMSDRVDGTSVATITAVHCNMLGREYYAIQWDRMERGSIAYWHTEDLKYAPDMFRKLVRDAIERDNNQ